MKEEHNLSKRLFIALDIPGDIKSDIHSFTGNLLEKERGIKIVPASNIHVTLKFLGNININKIKKIENAIKITADSLEKFRYRISGKVGAFPNLAKARVVFMEIDDGSMRISEVYNLLENNLSKIKIRKEGKKFIPHVTVARIKGKKNLEKPDGSLRAGPDAWIDCHDILLFESRLRPSGAEYEVIGRFGLK